MAEQSIERKLGDQGFSSSIHWFDKVANLLEQNIRGVQIGIYSVAVCSLVIALRSVRPFKKFTDPRQIPKEFFRKHVCLNGTVMRIDFNPKPLLLVDHSPILLNSFRKESKGLKVGIEGVDLSANGISWLQTLVTGHTINFILLTSHPEYVSCIVTHKNKDIANQLVSLGFASVGPYNQDLDYDKMYKKYYQILLKQESKAESKGIGMWRDKEPTLLNSLLSKIPVSWVRFSSLRN